MLINVGYCVRIMTDEHEFTSKFTLIQLQIGHVCIRPIIIINRFPSSVSSLQFSDIK